MYSLSHIEFYNPTVDDPDLYLLYSNIELNKSIVDDPDICCAPLPQSQYNKIVTCMEKFKKDSLIAKHKNEYSRNIVSNYYIPFQFTDAHEQLKTVVGNYLIKFDDALEEDCEKFYDILLLEEYKRHIDFEKKFIDFVNTPLLIENYFSQTFNENKFIDFEDRSFLIEKYCCQKNRVQNALDRTVKEINLISLGLLSEIMFYFIDFNHNLKLVENLDTNISLTLSKRLSNHEIRALTQHNRINIDNFINQYAQWTSQIISKFDISYNKKDNIIDTIVNIKFTMHVNYLQ